MNKHGSSVPIRTIRSWFQNSTPVNDARRNKQYPLEDVANILAKHAIPELQEKVLKDKISSLEKEILELQSELKKQVNTKPMISQNNNSNITPAEEILLKSRLLEEFITKKTDYEFCSKRFEQDFHNKSAYDNSITNLFASSSEKSKLKKQLNGLKITNLHIIFKRKRINNKVG